MLKILVIHTNYTQRGGEDTVVEQEMELLKNNYVVDFLCFKNNPGIKGLFQFLISIWNIKSSKIVKKKIKDFNPDVIHLHNWHFASGPIIIRTAKKLGVSVVHTLHNYRLICPSGTLFYRDSLFLDSMHKTFPWKAVQKKVYKNSTALTFWLAFIVWFHKMIGTWKMIDKYICLTASSFKLFTSSGLNIN